ncbi:MAG: hypothetical protein WCA31_00985 [Acidimicrobiales bacterium]
MSDDRVFSLHLLRGLGAVPVRPPVLVRPRASPSQTPPHGTHKGAVSNSDPTLNHIGVGSSLPGPTPAHSTLGFSRTVWCWYSVGARPASSPQNGDGVWNQERDYFDGKHYAAAWVWYPSTPVSVKGRMVVTGGTAPSGFVQTLPGYWVKA